MARSLVILDPNSLLGKELVPLLVSTCPQMPRKYMHTRGEDEHLIIEVAGQAVVVPPLNDCDELASAAAVIITANPAPSLREGMMRLLASNPTLPCLDLAPQPLLQAQDLEISASHPQLRLLDPLLLLPAKILRAVASLGPQRAFFSCLAPVSGWGEAALEELASQAVARLSGEKPKSRLLPAVLAFDAVPYPEEHTGRWEEQLQALFPQVAVRLHAVSAGIFHAHGVLATLELQTPTTLQNLKDLLLKAGIILHKGSKQLAPSGVAGHPMAQVKVLHLSSREASFWAVGDHLLLLAHAACEALRSLPAILPE